MAIKTTCPFCQKQTSIGNPIYHTFGCICIHCKSEFAVKVERTWIVTEVVKIEEGKELGEHE